MKIRCFIRERDNVVKIRHMTYHFKPDGESLSCEVYDVEDAIAILKLGPEFYLDQQRKPKARKEEKRSGENVPAGSGQGEDPAQ